MGGFTQVRHVNRPPFGNHAPDGGRGIGQKWSPENVLEKSGIAATLRDVRDLLFDRVFTPLGIEADDLTWRNNQYREHMLDGLPRREFGAGAHANVSGAGVVVGSDKYDEAVKLLEFLTSPPAQEEIVAGSEFAANPAVLPPAHIADWASVKVDPIAVNEAGPLLGEAVALMLEVGWS